MTAITIPEPCLYKFNDSDPIAGWNVKDSQGNLVVNVPVETVTDGISQGYFYREEPDTYQVVPYNEVELTPTALVIS